MSDDLVDVPEKAAPRPDRMDTILTITTWVLVAALLSLTGFFGYSVYRVRQAEATATPALRLIETLRDEVRANPNDSALRVRLGEALGSAGKSEEAVEQFEAALQLDPNHTGAYLDLGILAMIEKDTAAADRYFRKVIELTEGGQFADVNERREIALYNLGLIAVDAGEYEEAVGFLKGALRIRRDASDTYYYLARAYKGLGETEAAYEQLETALAFDPNYAQAHFLMGELYMSEEDEINAAEHFRITLDIAPDAEPAIEALEAFGTPEERLQNATEALEDDDIEAALHEVLVARALAPESAPAATLHGRILVERGNNPEALAVYREAAELDPDDKDVAAEITRLEKIVPASEEGTEGAQ